MSDPPVTIPPPDWATPSPPPVLATPLPPSELGGEDGSNFSVSPSDRVLMAPVEPELVPGVAAEMTPATVPQVAVLTAPAPEMATASPAPEVVKTRAPETYAETDGATLWLRKWSLTIGDHDGSKALDLSELAFEFNIVKALNSTPFTCVLTVYNIDDNVISQMQKEMQYLYLAAGYQKPSTQYGKLFAGPIAWFKHGRKDATDTFVEIHAISNDTELNRAMINENLQAGHTAGDVVRAGVASMGGKVTVGQIPEELEEAKAPRSRTMFGMTRDYMRDVAKSFNATSFIDDDQKFHMLKQGETLKQGNEEVPVLNSKTGMIDVPSQTLGAGMEVRSLLNPYLVPGRQVKINEKDIVKINAGPALGQMKKNNEDITFMAQIAADGVYAIGMVRHWGHNRGNPWYTDISTMPVNPNNEAIKVNVRTSV